MRALKRGGRIGGGGGGNSLPRRPSLAVALKCVAPESAGLLCAETSAPEVRLGGAGRRARPLRDSPVDTRPIGRRRAATRTGKRARRHRGSPDRHAAARPATGGFVPGAGGGGGCPRKQQAERNEDSKRGADSRRRGQGVNTPHVTWDGRKTTASEGVGPGGGGCGGRWEEIRLGRS